MNVLSISPTPMTHEQLSLHQVASDSWCSQALNACSVEYCARVFARHWGGRRCLEMGPAEGVMTAHLYRAFADLTLVDFTRVEGVETYYAGLRRRFPAATVIRSLLEEFSPSGRFDTIVLGDVLEYVENPVNLLRKLQSWLAPSGVICCAVPNARSLHRQAAVMLQILDREDSLNPTDAHHGHRRVYNPESLRADFLDAGLRLRCCGGYWIKPLSNREMEEEWTPEMIGAFMRLGERYPDIAAEIYVIASAVFE
jgi:2-polyprenyl-3-methyl-5-hydroxy-6-metoxy-1,4-benzoquinol methylase